MASSKADERADGAGRQAERIHRRRNLEGGSRENKERKKAEASTPPPSYTARRRVRVKVRYTEVRKGKSPEAKLVRII